MESFEYKIMNETQDKHWWYLGRKKIVENIIKNNINLSKKIKIADAGCGFGVHISMLKQYGDVTALEIYDEALNELKNQWGNSIDIISWKSPQKLDKKFNLIVMTDVLEHIEQDSEAINWIYDHLHEGGYALLTVPAYHFLWTQMDDLAHHFRRYSRNNLLLLFKGRFTVKKISFYNFFLFPVKIAFVIFNHVIKFLFPNKEKKSYNDLALRLRFINSLFKIILYGEAKLIRLTSLPIGVSVIILVQKNRVL